MAGLRILDLTRFLPGALATQLLADLGADVIKIEGFPEGDYARGMEPVLGFQSINRNKRSLHLDFRKPEGRSIVARLIAESDAFVEVSRPGTMARYGLDYDGVRKDRPDIVYCSVSAYGQSGDLSDTPSHGYNIDALAGMLHVRIAADGTPYVGPDGHLMPTSLLGGHAAALAICSCLLRRQHSGEGAFIDASCWDSGLAGDPVNSALALNGDGMAAGFASRTTPKYAPYRTADDRFLMVCAVEPKFWEGFCQLISRPDLVASFAPGHAGDLGVGNFAIYDEIAGVLRNKTLADWETIFQNSGLPVTPVRTRGEALMSAHAEQRQIILQGRAANPPMVGAGVIISGERGANACSSPELGEHTNEILGEIGLSPEEIDKLLTSEIVR